LEKSGLKYTKWPHFDLDSIEKSAKVRFLISGDAWSQEDQAILLARGWILRATLTNPDALSKSIIFERGALNMH
jgi:hypothetical protein